MRNKIITPLLAATLVFSTANLRANEQIPTNSPSDAQEAFEPAENTDNAMPMNQPQEPRQVGAASTDAAQAAKKRQWQNIGIACLAVAVAATAIYLASTNGGHND